MELGNSEHELSASLISVSNDIEEEPEQIEETRMASIQSEEQEDP